MIFTCKPVSKAWIPSEPGSCLPVGATFYGLAIFTIICDVVIIFLPIPLLLRLNIKPAQKAGVVCLFLLGLFTTICSILRLTQIHRVAFGDGNSTMLVLWGTIEFNVGVCFFHDLLPLFHLTTGGILTNVSRTSSLVSHTSPPFSRAMYAISAPTVAANTITATVGVMRWKPGPRMDAPSCNRTLVRRNVRRVRN